MKNTLCDRHIVLLGEGPSHDEGATIAFKSRMARDLIQDCGFSLLVFESSFYQFIKLNRDLTAGQTITRNDIEAGIGWLWRGQTEIEPLLESLPDAVNAKRVTIVGMDDQSGGRGQDYTNFDLPVELTAGLESERQTQCRDTLNRRVIHSFTKADPYDVTKKQFILSCLRDSKVGENDQTSAMRASLIRSFQRDQLSYEAQIIGRDQSMYENFEYWFDQYNQPKTIIWSSTVHAAKSGRVISAFGGTPNMGELVQTRFGDDAYVLGVSALSGTRGRPGRDVKSLPDAPDSSIETLVFENTEDDIVFVNTDALAAFGRVPASGIGNQYETRNWDRLLDGLIVFREQRPLTLMPLTPK